MKNIPVEELAYDKGYKMYTSGYRIVCFYKDYYAPIKGLCVRDLKDFIDDLNENIDISNLINLILDKYLNLNKDAQMVAIYKVDGTELARKCQIGIDVTNNDNVIFKEELMYDYCVSNFVEDGYRIVYFYDDSNYSIGTFSETVEYFMMDFVESEPLDEDDIPPFISIDDLLNRYLDSSKDVSKVALYKIDGTCVAKKERVKHKLNK